MRTNINELSTGAIAPSRSKKSPLLIIFLVVFIDLVGFGIVIPILPYYAKQYGATATELGWLMTVYSGLQFFFAPLWGRLSDHIGRRPVLLISMLGSAVSMVGLGFAPSLFWLFACRGFAGISAANISTATAYIADVTSPENRAKGMGMIGAAFGLGFIFGPAIGGLLSRYGYSTPMFFAAALAACNVLFAFWRLEEPRLNAELREKNRTKRFDAKALRDTLGDASTRRATLAFFIATLGITQMEVVFAIFMLKRYGLNAQGAGGFLAFMGVIMVAIQGGLIGKLSKRFGESRLIIVGTLLMAVGLVCMGHAHALPGVAAALALLALGNGVTNPSLSSLASKGARPERRGATMGVYQSAGSLARVLGPPIAGWLYDAQSPTAPFYAAAGLMAFAFALYTSQALATSKVPLWIPEATKLFREKGWRSLVGRFGWRFFALFFTYYLCRDLILYVLLPALAAKGILTPSR